MKFKDMSSKPISDQKERDKGLDPSRSFIVQAPAGSGKTELLTRRFLLLLSMVDKPEEILAITFSRKAAAEMRARILASIQDYLEESVKSNEHEEVSRRRLVKEVVDMDRKKKWNLLENPGRLNIMTIDSLCASITKQTPLLSGIGGYSIIDDFPMLLYREAARRTILMVEDEGDKGRAVRYALKHLDNSVSALEKRLIVMLAKRDQWSRHIHGSVDSYRLRESLEGSLRGLAEDRLRIIRSIFPNRYSDSIVSSAQWSSKNMPEERAIYLKDISSLPGEKIGDLFKWKAIAGLLMTSNGSLRKPKGVNSRCGFPANKSDEAVRHKKQFQELLESLSGNDKLLSALREVKILPQPVYDTIQWKLIEALLQLLPTAEDMLFNVFAERGRSDFVSVSQAAMQALGNEERPTDLMLSLDIKIRHILVDEYQDTSRTQFDLLRALTSGWENGDGRTMFLVGDPMQSIYLFREAEVGLFVKTKETGISEVKPDFIVLNSNFRSQKNLVEWVNDSFCPAFPQKEDPFLGGIPYSPSKPVKASAGEGVWIYLFENGDEILEASKVVEIIKDIHSINEKAAILVRSRSHLKEIVPALKKAGVRYCAQKIDPLCERPVIRDLFSLLRAFRNPHDRTAWLSLLRAPWCGLYLKDIFQLCSEKQNEVIYELIKERGDNCSYLSKESKERLRRFLGPIKRGMDIKGRIPVRSLLEGVWISLGGPACVDKTDLKDAELFFALLESLSKAGELISLSEFESKVKELYASAGVKEGNYVEIMTIHESKGLEFDHVIIPGLGKRPRALEKDLFLWMEKDEDLFLAPAGRLYSGEEDPIYYFLNNLRAKKFEYEKERLFYVAATRAKKGLYMLGHVRENTENGLLKPESDSLLASLWPKLKNELPPELTPSSKCERDKNRESYHIEFLHNMTKNKKSRKKNTVRQSFKRLASTWTLSSPPEGIHTVISLGYGPSKKEGFIFEWAGNNARHLGTVLHRYFKRITIEGLNKWDSARIEMESSRMEAMLKELGISTENVNEIVEKGIRILSDTLMDKRGRWILEEHSESSSELAVSGVINKKIVSGVIDRTFVDKEGVRWIIDYKTGGHEGGALKKFLKEEKERYFDQLEQYGIIMKAVGEKRIIKKGLYFPALSRWIEW